MNPYVNAYKKHEVTNRRMQRRHLFSAGAALVFLLMLLSLGLVYKRTIGQQWLLDVQRLKQERKDLLTGQSIYLGQKQEYLSRERIIAYARENLNLEFPDPDRIRWIRVDAAPGSEAGR
jgi:hypothetical protein